MLDLWGLGKLNKMTGESLIVNNFDILECRIQSALFFFKFPLVILLFILYTSGEEGYDKAKNSTFFITDDYVTDGFCR